jgi:hypothetical protein
VIPVFGVAYISQSGLLRKMFESIDCSVDRLIVIDNSETGNAPCPPSAIHVSTRHNLGVSASWNLIIKASPWAPWWCISNSDIEFEQGDLNRLEGNILPGPGIYQMDGFAAFAITREAVAKIGLFDENFVPAYYEDNDYHRRAILMDVPVIQVPSRLRHAGSMVIRGSQHFASENRRTFPLNADYYQRKWGGLPGHETYATPFDRGGSPAQWEFDQTRLAELTWKPEKESR